MSEMHAGKNPEFHDNDSKNSKVEMKWKETLLSVKANSLAAVE